MPEPQYTILKTLSLFSACVLALVVGGALHMGFYLDAFFAALSMSYSTFLFCTTKPLES